MTLRVAFTLIFPAIVATCVFNTAASAQGMGERQVTMFGIIATPGGNQLDPRLATIAPQLQKLLPNHGFMLLESGSQSLALNQKLVVDMKNGFAAESQLSQVVDVNGKIQLRFTLYHRGIPQLSTVVVTPPNQLSLCYQELPDGSRLLIGIGAR